MTVAWNADHVFLAQAKSDGRFVSRTMCLIGGVNAKARQIAIGESKFPRFWCGFFARNCKGVHDPNRRCVVNHAVEFAWQSDPFS